MSKAIWKFDLEARPGSELISMPAGSRIISASVQDGHIVMWALVDPTRSRVSRQVWALWTGWDIPDMPDDAQFIGTVQIDALVWHIFARAAEVII